MTFFDLESLHAAAEQVRAIKYRSPRKIKVAYCGNCGVDRESVYLFFGDVPNEYVGSRICLTCGFAPGLNPGVKDKELRQQVLEADNHECVYCGAAEHLVIDHIIPHSRGGKAEFKNLLTACRSCNSRRQTNRTMVLRYGRFRK